MYCCLSASLSSKCFVELEVSDLDLQVSIGDAELIDLLVQVAHVHALGPLLKLQLINGLILALEFAPELNVLNPQRVILEHLLVLFVGWLVLGHGRNSSGPSVGALGIDGGHGLAVVSAARRCDEQRSEAVIFQAELLVGAAE